ncbi:uncharacterized protein LOC123539296 [Mercenaria mercenaria]|uniref:uncharacterized protein LOC123539296 n=1 Tax=Mercenaria mercenaria TaxID=6596 RepID=UPI00234EB21C|nr:uncharacterized protein LOC123539296 [Mercenaria mercenaria]
MNIKVRAFILLNFAGIVLGESNSDYSYCTKYAEYNTLYNLMKHDECMNVDSVFRHLKAISDHSVSCRTHIINLLAGHFGSHASTPHHCQCQGMNKLQQYHTGSGDGVSDLRVTCIKNHQSYRDMYYQFFESSDRHNHAMACRTHHSVWSVLSKISASGIGYNSCQKDIIYHLKYAFEQHTDPCTCTEKTHPSTSTHQSHGDACTHYDSFNKLLKLAEEDRCLSANSAWHYLDDLQAKDSECRKRIQKYLADKYAHRTSQSHDNCICHARRQLVNHQIHRMDNGSFYECKDNTHGTSYQTIEADLFSRIRTHGCKNHNYLWSKLEGVHHYCSKYQNNHCTSLVDCQQDIIVRAAIQYPTDHSDSCVCSQITTTTTSTSKTVTTHTTPTAPTSAVTMPSSTPTTTPPASATSVKVTQSSNTSMSTQRPTPILRFACNKLKVVEDIAKSTKATDLSSSYCDPNLGGSDDAFLLSTCNMTSPMLWKKGANVIVDCESSSQLIPTYTPITTFNGDSYAPLGAQSGIFLGCYNNGFKIAIQRCNGVPTIEHIENGSSVYNLKSYYVIV